MRVIELYQLKVVENCNDVYALPQIPAELNIKTHYERLDIAQSKKIHYLQFMLPGEPITDDEKLLEILKNEERA